MENEKKPGGGLARNVLSEMAYDALKDRIIELELAPGTKLNLDRLSQEFRISQTPIREALTRLVAENLVCMEPFKGFSVEPLLGWKEADDLMAVRGLLEGYAASKAAENIEQNDLDIMRRQIQVMEDIVAAGQVNVRAFNAADANFHLRYVLAANNPTLAQSYAALNVHVRIARLFQNRTVQLAREANREHEEILKAFEERDAEEAAARVRAHIRGMYSRLKASKDDEGALKERSA